MANQLHGARRATGSLVSASLLVLAVLSAPAAEANPMTMNFTGRATQAVFDPVDPLGGAVHAGSTMYSYLNFDTLAPDASALPDLGSYTLSGGSYGMAVLIDSILFPVMSTVNISITNAPAGAGIDQYAVFASEGTAGGLGDYFSLSMLLQDVTGSAFDSDALPPGLPDLGRFTLRDFTLSGQYTDVDGRFIQYEVQGNVVPEPASAGTVALALLGALAAGRRRPQKRMPDRQ